MLNVPFVHGGGILSTPAGLETYWKRGMEKEYRPRLIAWEITRRCNLKCKHCRAGAGQGSYAGELTTDEILQVLDNIAAHYDPIIILTGGEPLLRPDVFEIIENSVGLELRTVLATCGTDLTVETARRLKDAGIARIGVSLDGPDAATHDAFRGVPGAFEATLRGVGAAREAGLEFQVNTTITRPNAGDLRRILNLAVDLGAAALHPFLLVPTGRGREICDQVLVSGEYEEVLNRIYELALDSPIPLKPTCAPQYYRIFHQREEKAGRKVSPETHGLDAMTRGCLGGTGFAFISHVGKVQICGFMEEEAGDLRRSGLDFAGIWEHSQLYREMRDFKEYKGRCGVCEYRRWCGGCRARAFAVSEDYLAEEPYCTHVPSALRG